MGAMASERRAEGGGAAAGAEAGADADVRPEDERWVGRICRILDSGALRSLLDGLLDATIELTGADRGYLVVPEPDDPAAGFRVECARGIELEREPHPERTLSTTVVREALRTLEIVRLENALESSFRESRSIGRLRIASVLVVPVRRGTEAVAAIYLDTRRLTAVFTQATQERVARLIERVIGPVHEAAMRARLRAVARRDIARLKRDLGLDDWIGEDPALARVLEAVGCAAPTEATVLIQGESGSGKERLARAIHDNSARRAGPFVPVHCGAIPEALVEAELFGYEKGAFTGAAAASPGRVAAAEGGTLFLDEVGELPLAAQVKLLRLLEAREVQRLGRARPVPVSVRVVAATHRDLAAMARAGKLREDLLYRLQVIPIHVPPLRARGDDVRLLIDHFLGRAAAEARKTGLRFTEEALARLAAYAWPGNVRELENIVRRAAIFTRGAEIGADLLPDEVREGLRPAGTSARVPRTREELQRAKDDAGRGVERAFLDHVLEAAGGRVAEAARASGMNRTFLHELIERHGIDPGDYRRKAASAGASSGGRKAGRGATSRAASGKEPDEAD